MTAKDDPNIDWKAVDWHGKGTTQISKELGSTPPRVSYRRKVHAPETVQPTSPRYKQIDWAKVDWTQPSGDIAKTYGVVIGTVSKNRRLYAPETLRKIKARRVLQHVDWQKPTTQIAEEEGRSTSCISGHRKAYAPETIGKIHRKHRSRRGRFQWDKVDWKLRDVDIAAQLGCSRQAVEQQRKNYDDSKR